MDSSPSLDASKRTKIANAYSSPSWWYDIRGFFILHLCYQDRLIRLLHFFSANGSSQHLEIAVGSGSFLTLVMLMRQWIKRLPALQGVAIDYAPTMLSGAIRRLRHTSGWQVHLADAAHLPFADRHFATANMANALHCIPDVEGAVSEVFRVLRPGGTFAVNVLLVSRGGRWRRWIADRVAQWGIRKGILIRPYEESEVRELFLSHGFDISEAHIHGNDFCLLVKKALHP